MLSFLPALLFLAFPVVLNGVSFFVSTKGNIDFSLLIKKQMKIITKKKNNKIFLVKNLLSLSFTLKQNVDYDILLADSRFISDEK